MADRHQSERVRRMSNGVTRIWGKGSSMFEGLKSLLGLSSTHRNAEVMVMV